MRGGGGRISLYVSATFSDIRRLEMRVAGILTRRNLGFSWKVSADHLRVCHTTVKVIAKLNPGPLQNKQVLHISSHRVGG